MCRYVEQHKTLPPKKSTKRQDLSLAMFDKFTKRVKSALYDGESKEEGESWSVAKGWRFYSEIVARRVS